MTMARELSGNGHAHGVADSQADQREGRAGVGEKPLFELLTLDRALPAVLDAVCRSAERLSDGCRCGIYLIDWSGPRIESFVAPSLPASFNLSLSDLPLRHDTGPCARAAFLKMTVVAADLDTDPLWRSSPFRTLAAAHGLRSCWSAPIRGAAGEVSGILAILQGEPASPTPREEDLVGRLARIVGIALERAHTEAALERAGAELARMTDVMGLGASIAGEIIQPLSGVVINASTGLRMLAASPPDIEGACETLRRTLRDCSRASDMVTQLRLLIGRKRAEGHLPWETSSDLPGGA